MTSFSVAPLSNLFARGINRFVSVVEKKRSASIRSFSCLLLAFACLSQVAWGQVTTNGGSGLSATYPNLAAAITALNGATVSSPIIITLSGNETAPAGGFAITASGTASNTITIRGSASVITAGLQTAGSQSDAIFKIVGGDFITIENFSLQENIANTVTSTISTQTMTEFGVALFPSTATNGAQNNTIQNNIITLSSSYPNAIGVMSTSSNSSVFGTLEATSTAGTNSGNRIYKNTISGVAYGVYVVCPPLTATIFETGIDIGGTSVATANVITFGHPTTSSFTTFNRFSGSIAAGIYFRNGGAGSSVRFNTITSNSVVYAQTSGIAGIIVVASASPATGLTYVTNWSDNTITLTNNGSTQNLGLDHGYGIATGSLTTSNNIVSIRTNTTAASSSAITGIKSNYPSNLNTITGNTISTTQAPTTTGSTASAVTGITAAGVGSVVTVSQNLINIAQSLPTGAATYGSGAITYIDVTAGSTTVTVSNNQLTTTGSTIRSIGTMTGINHNGTISGLLTISNNTAAIDRVAASGSVFGTSESSSPSTVAHIITGNSFSFTSISGTSLVNGIRTLGGAASNTPKQINNNTISVSGTNTGQTIAILGGWGGGTCSSNSITINNSSTDPNGIWLNQSGAGAYTITSNTISITSNSVAPTSMLGIRGGVTGPFQVFSNTFSNLSFSGVLTSTAAPTVSAISVGAGDGSNVYNNTISNISIGAAGSSGSPIIQAILVTGGTTTNVFKNKIFGITCASTLSPTVGGIQVSGGTTVNVFNNLIGGLQAPNANSVDAVRGINLTSSATSSINVYHNTIYLDATSTGANFGTSGIFHTASTTTTTATLNLQNNLIFNNSTPAGTGLSVAYRRSAVALNNYAISSNNNFLYAGTPGASRLIFFDGTNSDQTLPAFKTRVAPIRESASVSSLITFQSTTGSSSDFLKFDLSPAYVVESAATPISSIVDDYAGTIRFGNTGHITCTPVAATATDIGAWELCGTPASPQISNLSITPGSTQCVNTPRQVVATVTPLNPLATNPTLSYSVNGTLQGTITMTALTGSLSSAGTWSATIPVVIPSNGQVTWQIQATDGTLSSAVNGTSYSDEPLLGVIATATASPTVVCQGSNTTLDISLTKPGSAGVGLGASTSSSVGVSFFPGGYGGAKTQYIIRASELTAAGLFAGAITAVSFEPTTSGQAYQGFSVHIGHTTQSSMTTTFVPMSGLSQVYLGTGTDNAFTPVANAVNTLQFGTGTGSSSSFVWDGVSNVILTFSWSRIPAATTATASSMKVDATGFTSSAYDQQDSQTPAGMLSSTLADGTATSRPRFVFSGVTFITPSSVSWSNGTSVVGTTSPLATPVSTATMFTGTATVSGCPISASTSTVTVNPLPTAPVATNSTQCGTKVPTASVTDPNGFTTPTFRWYSAGTTTATLLQSSVSSTYTGTVASTTTFHVSVINPATGCESARTPVTVTVVTANPITASASVTNIACLGSGTNLSVTQAGTTNTYSLSWSLASYSGSGLAGPVSATLNTPLTVVPTAAGTYNYIVVGTESGGLQCRSESTVSVVVNNPLDGVTSVSTASQGGSVCLGSPVTLTNVSSVFQTTNGGARLAPAVTTNTTPVNYGLVFDVFTAFTLNSVKVYPSSSSAGTLTIVLQNSSATVLTTTSVSIPAGNSLTPHTINLGWNIPAGTGYRILAATGPAMVRESALGGFPYLIGDVGSVTSGFISGTSSTYYYFYDWSVSSNQVLAPSSISWSNGTSVVGTTNPLEVVPTATTSYSYSAIVNGCPITASPVTVTTIALPTAPTATNSNQCGAQVPLASVTDQNGFTNPVFRWYSAGTSTATLLQSSTSATYTGTVAATTTFHVSVINPTTGCESLRTPVTVSVTQPNPLTAAATVSTVNCLGGGTSLSVTQTGTTNTYVLTWTASSYAGSGMSASTSATLNTPIALVPTAAGTYTFTVTGVEASTGCVAVSSVGVVVNDPLLGVTASASITPTVICAGAPTTLTMNLARTPLTESFDGNPLSQFTLLNVAGTSGSVTTSTTYFAEGTGSVRLNAGTNADVRLVQNSSINLSNAASATLTFSHICASEDTYDFGVPIFSTDGGATWFAFPASSYQGSGTLAFANDIGFDKASYSDWNSTFTSSSSTPGTGPATSLWKTETIAIPAGVLTSTNFKVAFAYSTDGSVNYYGWLIDNVSLRIIPNATYSWSNGTSVVGTTNPLTITPTAGNYSLTGTATVGGCPISAAAVTLTVNPLPSVAAITGTAAVCVGNTTTLTNTTAGGVWTSANAAVATISSTGVVTGVTAGTSTITYTVTNATTGCVNSVTQLVTVNALPVVSTITGTASVCVGLTTTLSTTTAGGVWSSANTAIATVSATGVVSGISAGSVTISYTVTNSNNCVTTVTRVVTVNPLPVVPAITGASSVCMNSSITLANTTPNGVWTTSNSAVASVSSSGVVTGIAGGTAIITYTVTSSSGCVTAVSTVVTVNILPSVTGVITQPTTCVSFDGAINITAAGPAVGPYSYTWSTPNGIDPVVNAEDQTGLIVGDYNVVVTAANGCTVNRTFTLVGPGGCDICPTITSMTASPNPPCVGSPTTLTVSGLSDMGVTFGITFKMSTTPLTNPYTQGTVIQTVTNSGLSNGNTSATASVSFPAPGTYYVYSIITPQPLGVACRPTKSVTITVDPLPTVTAISNQIVASGSSTTPVVFAGGGVSATYNWTNSNTALIPISQGAGNIAAFAVNNSGTSPISTTIAAIATSPNAAGQSCVGTTATSFTITVNPVPTMAQPANTTLVNAIASTAINFATLNTGGTTTYAWTNSNPAIGLAASGTGSLPVFTPVNAGTAPVTATITVTPTYTNANGGPSTAGASREFTITVNPTAQVNTVANQFVCSGATLSSTVFGTVNTGGTTTYAWTNSNTAIGLAASGTGNIPAFAATNAQAGVISSTITVTPSYTNAGITTAGTPVSYVITVNPAGQVNPVLSQVLCAGSTTTAATLSTTNQQGINVPASATASSGAISLAIPDNAPAGVTSTLPVSLPAGATVTGVRVTLNATHTWVSDLVINLRAPNGQVLNLFNGHGGSGDDLVNTVISSAGTASLASATAPFTGTFAATGALNVGATGQTSTTSGFPALYSGGSGNWVLSLRDQVGFDVGTLNSWAITVDYTTLLGGLTTYTWTNSNSGIGLAASGSGNTIAAFTASNTTSAPIVSTVTVTPTYTNGGLSCAGAPITYTYTVNPIPTVNVANQVLCAGTPATVNFTGATTGTVYNWTSSNAAIGLAVSGTGNLSFTPTNTTNAPISSTVTVTPVFTNAGVSCTGTPRTFTITVNPVGQVNTVLNQVLCNGANTTPVSFATVNGGGTVVAGTPVTANSGAITVAVPDFNPAGATHSLPVTLPAGATITGVSVNFNMTHTWLADMVVNLRAPNGQVLNLVNRRGGSGDNFVNTTISSASTTSLATGAAPFTGTFAADAALNVGPTTFVSTATNFAALYSVANGDWTLGMRDYAGGDLGTLTGWSITFNYTTVEGAVTTYNWTNNTPSIGLAASGVGNIASFAAANTTAVPVTATVTVTPTYTNSGVGCAGPSTTFTYTVNPTPTVAAVSNQTVCRGASVAAINFAGTVSGTVYNWTNNNTAIGLGASGTGNIPSFVGTNTTSAPISATITVTPVSTINGITCTGTPRTFTITINPIPTVNAVASFAICHNSPASVTFSGATTGTVYNWTNSNTTIGLGASGSGNLAFTALNTTSGPQVANIVVTPAFTNGGTTCTGTPTSFTITVNPLPVVSAGSLPARICISDTLVPLNGTPVGGSWSGIGTSGMSFVPTATAVGTWPITYTFADLNGCVNRATVPVTVLSCDERDRDLNSSGVQLYPNPNNGRFNLRVNSTRFNMLGMRVFNTAGQLVSVKQWSNLVFARVVPVDLSNLPAGIYMVRLYYGDGMDRGADKTFQVIIAR